MSKLYFMMKNIAILAAILTALSSCTKEVTPPPQEEPAKTRGGYPIERVQQNNACFDIDIEYPFFGRPELDQQVRLWVDENYYDMSEEMQAMCAQTPPAHGPYEFKGTYELNSTVGSISVVFKSWSYTGGAHGQDNVQTLVMAVKSGEDLRYKDLFASTGDLYTFLSDYVYSALSPKLGDIWQGSPMFTEGLEPIEASFKNFAVTPKGLTIYFPTYQIAPYSEGPQTCEVPLEVLVKFRPKPGIWQ